MEASKIEIDKLLLDRGAIAVANCRDALHVAVSANNVEMMRMLVVHGADVNARGKWGHGNSGWTPLEIAVPGRRNKSMVDIDATRRELTALSTDVNARRAAVSMSPKWSDAAPVESVTFTIPPAS